MMVSELIEALKPYENREILVLAGGADTVAELGAPLICQTISVAAAPDDKNTVLIYAEE